MAILDISSQTKEDTKANLPVRYLDTTTAYDLWSEVYDTDGNFLQALDTVEMQALLPKALSLIPTRQPWKLIDIGCGTGRNTMQLLIAVPGSTIVGLEPSSKMLEIARSCCTAALSAKSPSSDPTQLHFEQYDMLADHVPLIASSADGIISTLVLEHVPIADFFLAASKMLKPGGVLLVTNMHSEMGAISQAGFVDPRTGEKIRPTSFVHTVEDVVHGAEKEGFEVVERVLERGVDERLSCELGPRSKKWIGVTVWFGVCFRKKTDRP